MKGKKSLTPRKSDEQKDNIGGLALNRTVVGLRIRKETNGWRAGFLFKCTINHHVKTIGSYEIDPSIHPSIDYIYHLLIRQSSSITIDLQWYSICNCI
jgi:hypothetical protein